MVRKLSLPQSAAWLKLYGQTSGLRSFLNRIWNLLMARLGLALLCSPPRHRGDQAKAVERRRLAELQQAGALVPDVLGEGRDTLLLTDIGATLAHQLKRTDDPAQKDLLVSRVAQAMAAVHARGSYLGQAFPRNITVSGAGVGFIDFEDDPGEIMSLDEAQARDWVMFCAGASQYYRDRADKLTDILRAASLTLDHSVARLVARTASRLRFLDAAWLRRLRAAGALSTAVHALRGAFQLCLLALAIDYASDGDFDLPRMIAAWV